MTGRTHPQETELVQCPCGQMFVRTNWTHGAGAYRNNHRGRPRTLCESCRALSRKGMSYGIELANKGGEIKDDKRIYV